MKRADHKDTQGKGIPGSRDTTQRPGGGTSQEVRDEREESSAEAQWARRMRGGRWAGPGHTGRLLSGQGPGPTGECHALLTVVWRRKHRGAEADSRSPIRRPV